MIYAIIRDTKNSWNYTITEFENETELERCRKKCEGSVIEIEVITKEKYDFYSGFMMCPQ